MSQSPDELGRMFDRAMALHGHGQLAEAEPLYLHLFKLKPNHHGLLSCLGLLRLQQGRPAQSLEFTEAALRLKPDDAGGLLQHSMALQHLGRLEPALASVEKALELAPEQAVIWQAHADALLRLGRLKQAVASYSKVLALAPDNIEALASRGAALCGLGRADEALADFDQVAARRPDDAGVYRNRARALMDLDRPADALLDYDRAIALAPDFAETVLSRGVALGRLERPREALESFDRALALKPDYAEALYNRGEALTTLGDRPAALQSYDQALALRPDYPEALLNKGFLALTSQDFAQGWRLYENRKRLAGFEPRSWPAPLWLGETDITGKTLLVHAEQGLGDTLQFCRYAQLARGRGINVILAVQDRLVRLLQGMTPPVDVIAATATPATFDFQTPLLSLPLAFGTNGDCIPAAPFYLAPEAALVRHWKERLGAQGFKIGIAWQGQKRGNVDTGRSFALSHFAALAQIPGLRLISLQKYVGSEQLRDCGMTVETLGEEFDAGPDAFVDTAAAMQSLDLVISSDTSIAHLAGALGRPVWVALQFSPDWRWFLDRADSPWYPAMRLFRQPSPGDWQSVFAAIASALRAGRESHA